MIEGLEILLDVILKLFFVLFARIFIVITKVTVDRIVRGKDVVLWLQLLLLSFLEAGEKRFDPCIIFGFPFLKLIYKWTFHYLFLDLIAFLAYYLFKVGLLLWFLYFGFLVHLCPMVCVVNLEKSVFEWAEEFELFCNLKYIRLFHQ